MIIRNLTTIINGDKALYSFRLLNPSVKADGNELEQHLISIALGFSPIFNMMEQTIAFARLRTIIITIY